MRYNINEDKFSKVSRSMSDEPRAEWMLNLAADCDKHECTVDGARAVAKVHPIHGLISTH